MMQVFYPIVKLLCNAGILVGLGFGIDWKYSWAYALGFVFLIFIWENIVALICCKKTIPSMDHQTFLTDKEGIHNYLNLTFQDCKSKTCAEFNFERLSKMLPKLNYKIVPILGDYYYQ